MPEKIEISPKTIFLIFGLILGVWFILRVYQILLILFISFIIMSALKPAVRYLEKFKINRAWSIVTVYVVLWSIIGGIIAAIIPPLVAQTQSLLLSVPASLDNFQFFNVHQQEITNQLLSMIGSLPENVFNLVSGLFGNIINLFTTVVISFYMLTERENLGKYLHEIFGKNNSLPIISTVSEVESKLGEWVRGELLLMLIIGVMSYVGLRILGIETAIPLAILAGLLEAVPTIGPIISAIPAAIFAFTVHPFLALSVVALYFIIQNLENSFIVPLVMRRAVGVNPLVGLLSLMIGFEIAGPVGAVLSIPIVLVSQIILTRHFSSFIKE
jgi:predicted PurR-regulated permease PerM